ncbi:hypothetical protein AYI87_11345 [Shewanella sp. KCT]|nr:hypothetical protein AYI87_11345 [Shewanella sp. KCT]
MVPSSSGNQDNTIGGVVHLNIDGDSETYGKFTPVYGFHEHGVGLTWQQQLDVVRTQPLLAETSAGQVLFLVTDTSYDHFGGNEVNPSEAISLVPSDIDDWSKPWQMIGAPGSGGIGKPAQNIWYDSHNDELWFAMELSPTDFLEDSVVFKRKGPTGKVESNNIFIPKEYWVTSPQAIFSQAGKTYLFTAGYRSGCPSPFQCRGKILQVGLNNQATIRETFSSYDVSPTAWLLAGGLSSSLSTGYHYLNAVPNMDEKNFRTSLGIAKDNLRDVDNPLEDPLLTKSLDELYSDFDILPSQMDRYDFQNFGRINLFKGSTESGYTLIGSPAIGGLKSEPLTDRFIVSLAITGGTHGAGAIVKHDRFNNTTTSIPLGTSMPIAPAGQAIQLENGTILGGTLKLSHSGLAPQKPDVGVWIKADDAASIVEYELPSTTGRCGSSSQCLIDALYAPKTFVKAATGDIWSAVSYQVFDIGIDFSCFLIGKACTRETMALVKFDAETGKPTGDIHILADSPTLVGNYFTEASIAQNILTYVTPALRNDPVTIGERLWIADVSAEAKPEFNMVMLSPEGGELNTAWSTPFAPTAQKATGHFYFMTLATSAGEEVRVHRMELGDIVTDKPSLMTVISGETKIPSTPLFEGSDGMFYYGTRDGALMQFNPEELIVIQVADLVETGMTSDARGFISELSEGVISGIVVDSSASESEVATRAYMYDLETQIIEFVDVSDRISVSDTFPGLLPITREVAN